MDEWTPLNGNCTSSQRPGESSTEPSHPSSGEEAGDTKQTEFMHEKSHAAGSGEDSNTEQTELIHEEPARVGSAEDPDVEQMGMTFQGPTRGGPIKFGVFVYVATSVLLTTTSPERATFEEGAVLQCEQYLPCI